MYCIQALSGQSFASVSLKFEYKNTMPLDIGLSVVEEKGLSALIDIHVSSI